MCKADIMSYDTFSFWISTWNVAHRPKYQARRKISPLTYFGRLKEIKILKNDTNLFQFPGWTPKNINYIFLSIFGFKHHSLSWNILAFGNNNYQGPDAHYIMYWRTVFFLIHTQNCNWKNLIMVIHEEQKRGTHSPRIWILMSLLGTNS